MIRPGIDIRKMYEEDGLSDYKMFPLHDYQKDVKDRFVPRLMEPSSRQLLHMPTGSGKTKTAVEGIVDFWRSEGNRTGFIVWLAHTRELCQQAYDTFKEVWLAKGDVPISMSRMFGDHSPDLTDLQGGICFVGFQKLHSWLGSANPSAILLRQETRLVVVDEAHKALAATYFESIDRITTARCRLLGLTATPGRSSDPDSIENKAFAEYFNKIHKIEYDEDTYESEIRFLQTEEYLAKLRRIPIKSGVRLSQEEVAALDLQSIDLPESVLLRLSADGVRNTKIVGEITKAVKGRGDATLVFATSVPHCTILKFLLQKEDIRAECVFGSTHHKRRDAVIRDFKDDKLPVLINYQVLTTGFDATNLKTLVIARPTHSVILYSQMIGRALRGPRMGGQNPVNTLVNVEDNDGRFGDESAAFTFFDHHFDI